MPQIADESVAKYTSQTGMATSEQIESAREQQESAARSGKPISLCEALVQQGVITPQQREAVEKRLLAQEKGGIQQLGNYRLLKKLGEGGMGAVYLAEDTVVGRKVAVKILPKKFAEDHSFLSRFRREARAMGKLNHQNVVAAFDVGEDLGHHYYVMEYCEGEPLDKMLDREKVLPLKEAVELMLQAARGLEHAHSQGIIHRDIKPANLFVTKADRTVKILDLGLSKNISDVEQSFNTQSGVVLGTPHYISPEQALGDKNIDGRTDIYSLGATFYHLLTGQTPFHGPSIPVILTKHLTEQLPNPQDLREGVPPEVVAVLQKMMAKKPEHRHANCGELISDFEALAKGTQPVSGVLDATLSSIALPAAARANSQARTKVHRTSKHEPVKGEPIAKQQLDAVMHRPVHQTNQGTLMWAGVGAAAVLLIGIAFMFAGSGAKSEPQKKPAASPLAAADEPKKNPAVQVEAKPTASTDLAKPEAPRPQPDPKRPPLPDERQFREVMEAVQPLIENALREGGQRRQMRAEMREDREERRTQTHPAETDSVAPALPAPDAARAAAKIDDRSEQKATQTAELRQKIEPLLKQNRMVDALKALESAKSDPAFSDVKDVIKQEQADIEAIRSLRSDAIAELRKMEGKEVSLKFNTGVSKGVVLKDGNDKAVFLRMKGGPDLSRSADVLDIADVDAYAPKDAESMRRRGLMFLAADDLAKARASFEAAAKQGKGDEVQPYLARVDQRDAGSKEAQAAEMLKRLEAALASRNSTQARMLIDSLQKDFGATEAVKARASDLEEKLEALQKPEGPAAAPSKIKVDENFVRIVSSLPPHEQFPRVTEKLRELNPNFEDRVRPMWGGEKHDKERPEKRMPPPAIDNAQVCTADITDISPIRALTKVTTLNLQGCHDRKSLADISPLRGLELKALDLQHTLVSDLSPLRGMGLMKLSLEDTEVTDLSPLQDMPLKYLGFSPRKITKGLEVIKTLKNLDWIYLDGE
ncbi:MAG TPA: serine/threonine-protein kinase, partial [Planctomycetota bacterium]|nr:serine/threonine-protein kinase [Planctomycetota bacterium]